MGTGFKGPSIPGGNGMPDWFQAAMRQQQAAMNSGNYMRPYMNAALEVPPLEVWILGERYVNGRKVASD